MLLSVASAAGAVATGCASVTDVPTSSQTLGAGHAPGLVVEPPDSGGFRNAPDTHVVVGVVPIPASPDAGTKPRAHDAGHLLGSVATPPDGGLRVFPGVIIRPGDAGLASDDAGKP
jgi:hypothetical protein